MPEPLFILPVAAQSALQWAKGAIHDRELFFSAPLTPEAVFIGNLPDRQSVRACIGALADWRQRGAVCLIARTANDIVRSHLMKRLGALPSFLEKSTEYRLFVPPDGFNRYIDRVTGRL